MCSFFHFQTIFEKVPSAVTEFHKKAMIVAKETCSANHRNPAYGPAESATFFLAKFNNLCLKIVPVRLAFNIYVWIVNSENFEFLSPLGAIGEMFYESSGFLKEHLEDLKKTKEVLTDAPS